MRIDWLLLCQSADPDYADGTVNITGAGADSFLTGAPASITVNFVLRLSDLPDDLAPDTHVLDIEVRRPDDTVLLQPTRVTASATGPTLPDRRTMLMCETMENLRCDTLGQYNLVVSLPDGTQTVRSPFYVMAPSG